MESEKYNENLSQEMINVDNDGFLQAGLNKSLEGSFFNEPIEQQARMSTQRKSKHESCNSASAKALKMGIQNKRKSTFNLNQAAMGDASS